VDPASRAAAGRAQRAGAFTSISVSFDNAYGGKNAGKPEGFRFFPFNAVGKGYLALGTRPEESSLPTSRTPATRSLLVAAARPWPSDQSAGHGSRDCAGRHLQQALVDARAPLLPRTSNDGYYNCAPETSRSRVTCAATRRCASRTCIRSSRFPVSPCRGSACVPSSTGEKRNLQLRGDPSQLGHLVVDMEASSSCSSGGAAAGVRSPGDSTILIVEESLTAGPRPAEGYRSRLAQWRGEAASAEAEAEQAEHELEPGTGRARHPRIPNESKQAVGFDRNGRKELNVSGAVH